MCSCKRHGDQYATCTCSCPHPAPTTPPPDGAARADIDLDEVRKRHKAASDEVVRLCSPGGRWRMSIPADEKRDSDLVLDVALADIPALVAEVRRLTESLDAARIVAEYLEDEVSVERTRTIKAEAERDELRATVERVQALADESMSSSCIHVNDLTVNLRAALHPQEPHTPAQDASSTPDGSKGAGSGSGRERGLYAAGRALFEESALGPATDPPGYDDRGAPACGGAVLDGTPVLWTGPESPPAYVVPRDTCGHTLHDGALGRCEKPGGHKGEHENGRASWTTGGGA